MSHTPTLHTPMKVAVVGTGYVGLGTAALLAYFGHQVMGIDIDQSKIDMLQRGELPIYEPGLERPLMAECGDRLHWTTDYSAAIPGADVIFICVGTPAAARRTAGPAVRGGGGAGRGPSPERQDAGGREQEHRPGGHGDWVARIIEEHAPDYKEHRTTWSATPSSCARARRCLTACTRTGWCWAATTAREWHGCCAAVRPLIEQTSWPRPKVPRA